MSTRGAYGFRVNGEDKVTYNHSDSYPSYLGKEIASFIRRNSDATLMKVATKTQLIDESIAPTKRQKEVCRKGGTVDLSVSKKSEDEWYCLLRKAQGNLIALKKVPFMIDSHDFLADSLSCEHAYIINLDTLKLEVYGGFNLQPGKGRYAQLRGEGLGASEYWGVSLVLEIPFEEIRKMDVFSIVEMMEKACDEETVMEEDPVESAANSILESP